ncbi:MAG: DUF4159 domain-containing protein [Bdellovibrionales bacterium]
MAQPSFVSAKPPDDDPVSLTSRTWLAYMRTGDRAVDQASEAGLSGLALELAKRTSVTNAGAVALDPARLPNLAYYPLIYWPLAARQKPLSQDAARSVNDYLRHGGMILFDAGDNGTSREEGDGASPAMLRHMLSGADIPPLEPLPKDHVLTKSFYLLDSFPGRADNKDFWMMPEDESSAQDGVSGVFFGANGWAAAWAMDSDGSRPLYPCSPGGETQREMAYRFGINLVVYALTGNYKADQVHAKALLERMGR